MIIIKGGPDGSDPSEWVWSDGSQINSRKTDFEAYLFYLAIASTE